MPLSLEAKVFNVFKNHSVSYNTVINSDIRLILKDLKITNKSTHCPAWSCEECCYLFPQSNLTNQCPCYTYKSTKYLINRLTKVKTYWEKLLKTEKRVENGKL